MFFFSLWELSLKFNFHCMILMNTKRQHMHNHSWDIVSIFQFRHTLLTTTPFKMLSPFHIKTRMSFKELCFLHFYNQDKTCSFKVIQYLITINWTSIEQKSLHIFKIKFVKIKKHYLNFCVIQTLLIFTAYQQ